MTALTTSAAARDGMGLPRGPQRLFRYLASPQFLVLSYIFFVLFQQRALAYLSIAFFLLGLDWKFSLGRVAVYCTLAASVLVLYAKPTNVGATATFLLVALGLFAGPRVDTSMRPESKLTICLALATLVLSFIFTDVFDFNEGVVSHNFIPIVGLYLLTTATGWKRGEIAALAGLMAVVVFAAGSRSGAAILFLLCLYVYAPRLALIVAAGLLIAYALGVAYVALPAQFERNYESDADPRFLIWLEYFDAALSNQLFGREDFIFMDLFDLDRNFHNSLLEAYYRLGAVAVILLVLHLRLIGKLASNPAAAAIYAGLLFKALFDTYLWFTPVDLIVFQAYGATLFAGSRSPGDRS